MLGSFPVRGSRCAIVLVCAAAGCTSGDPGVPPADDEGSIPVSAPVDTDVAGAADSDDSGSDDTDVVVVDDLDDLDDLDDTDDTDDTGDSDAVPRPPPLTVSGGFVDVTAATWSSGRWYVPTIGPSAWPAEAPAALGDLDGDGVPEVLPDALADGDVAGGSVPPLARRPDGSWAPSSALAAAVDPRLGKVIAAVDLDGDGDVDLLRASTSATIALGPLLPTPRPISAGIVARSGRANAATGAALVDIDADGWLDVALAQDACGIVPPMTVLHRVGLSAWEERIDLAPLTPQGGGALVLPIPLATPGEHAFLLTAWKCASAFHPGFYAPTGTTADGLPTFSAYDATPADAWFKQTPQGVGTTINQSAPMGAALVDLDADDALELIVTVGEARQYVYRLDGTTQLEDVTGAIALDFPKLAGTTEREAWAVVPVDVDLDGRPDLAIAQGDDAVARDLPIATRVSYPRVFLNGGPGAWRDVSTELGLDTVVGNWHALLVGDLDHDLDADLVVGGYGYLPRVWRNDVVAPGHPLVLRLRGTTSNHLGVGAQVRVFADGIAPQLRVIGDTASPDVLAEPVLFLGLGAAHEATVEVTWPSGLVQRVEHVAGAAVIEEWPTITLSEADRHVDADGTSTVEVVVTPRAADGSLRAADVDIVLAVGTGTWAGPAVRDGTTWRRTLIAPQQAGIAVIEATIDRVPVTIRPRVWWEDATP